MNEVSHSMAMPVLWASETLRPFLSQVAVAITSTLLAVFGGEINRWFRGVVRDYHFVLRVAAFVLLVAFGYGAANLALSHVLAGLLMNTSNLYLSPVILGTFTVIGILAEHKRQI